jgi:hypothetical protein
MVAVSVDMLSEGRIEFHVGSTMAYGHTLVLPAPLVFCLWLCASHADSGGYSGGYFVVFIPPFSR